MSFWGAVVFCGVKTVSQGTGIREGHSVTTVETNAAYSDMPGSHVLFLPPCTTFLGPSQLGRCVFTPPLHTRGKGSVTHEDRILDHRGGETVCPRSGKQAGPASTWTAGHLCQGHPRKAPSRGVPRPVAVPTLLAGWPGGGREVRDRRVTDA